LVTSLGEQGVVSFGVWLGGGWADGGRGMDGQEPAGATWLSKSQAYGPDGSGQVSFFFFFFRGTRLVGWIGRGRGQARA